MKPGSAPLQLRRRESGAATVALDGLHPVLGRIYAARGITARAQLEHRLSHLAAPHSLGGIDAACALLERALRERWRIIVVGDFDADGATGTAVAVRGLRALGAHDVGYRVPNRFVHGYGLSESLVSELVVLAPRLIVTVDNGVASHAGIAAARAQGIEVLVTDHHLPGETLPNASAMVNPNLAGDAFPSKYLAGVGVMFYLLLALRAWLRQRDWFTVAGQHDSRPVEPDLSSLLDLIALGTVADLVPLDFNNRVLVEAGLRRIRAGTASPGIAALIEASQRRAEALTATDLAFALGPRINAAGRLEDMSLGIECLLTDDAGRARDLAGTLSAINSERRELQSNMVEQGEALVQRFLAAHGAQALPFGVVLAEREWHAGVIGLVASRLKDRLHRPVIACSPAGDDSSEWKASARSIAGFHLRDALAEVDARHPGLITRFGGHAMAAGLSLPQENVPQLASAFDAVARERIAPELLDPVLWTDGGLAGDDFDLELARALRFGGPWGQAFPEPLFDDEFVVQEWRVMGDTHLRFQLRHASRTQSLEAVMFGCYDGSPPPARFRAAYHLQLDEWNGRERLRLLLRHIEAT